MVKLLLWLVLLVACWPPALLGIAFEGVFELLRAIVLLPARLLGGAPGTVRR